VLLRARKCRVNKKAQKATEPSNKIISKERRCYLEKDRVGRNRFINFVSRRFGDDAVYNTTLKNCDG